jgi:hypothetical protein
LVMVVSHLVVFHMVVLVVVVLLLLLLQILRETCGVVADEVVVIVHDGRGSVSLELASYAYHRRPGRLVDCQRHQPR